MRIIGVFSVLTLVLSSALVFQGSTAAPPAAPELGKWWKNSEIVGKLQLSQGQVDEIERIFLDFRPALANLNTELKNREAELRALMSADPVDESRVLNQTELIAQSRAALEKANSSMMVAIRKELSKEQWDKLQQTRELRRVPGLMAAQPRAGQRGDKIYRVQDGIRAPLVIYQPLPSYTQEAKDARIEGIVLLQGIFRSDGRITDLKVLRGIGYGLDESAVRTISKEWRFEPGTLNGEPVDVQANIEVSFRLY